MKTWDQFHPFITPDVMGCPDPLINHHLRLAVREFCQRSGAWREWVDAFTADGNVNRWDYDLAGQQSLVKVARALRNEEELFIKAGASLPSDWQTSSSTQHSAQDTLIHLNDAEFMVFPRPGASDVITCELVFQPSMTAAGVGDVIFNSYADDVASGCKARLMIMSKEPWADMAQAAIHQAAFERAIQRAANADFSRTGRTARRTAKACL